MLNKIKDYFDYKVHLLISIDNDQGVSVLENVLGYIGKDRLSYKTHNCGLTGYMMELRMPYNRYMEMMKSLQKIGWNLAQISNVGVIDKLIKL